MHLKMPSANVSHIVRVIIWWLPVRSSMLLLDCYTLQACWLSDSHRYIMMTSSNENIFRVTSHFWEESTGHRWIPLTKSSDTGLFFVLCLNKRLSKHSRRRCFETPLRSLWRHCDDEAWLPSAWRLSLCLLDHNTNQNLNLNILLV